MTLRPSPPASAFPVATEFGRRTKSPESSFSITLTTVIPLPRKRSLLHVPANLGSSSAGTTSKNAISRS
jgi:hypothetical protein